MAEKIPEKKGRGRPRKHPKKDPAEKAKPVGRPRTRPKRTGPSHPTRGRPRIHPPSTGRPAVDPIHKKLSLALSMRRCAWDGVEKLAKAAGLPHSIWIEQFVIVPFLKAAGINVPPPPPTRKEAAEIKAAARKQRSLDYQKRRREDAGKAE